MDWQSWHEKYDQPGSRLAQRLKVVQALIRSVLDGSPAGPLRVVSLCAGQARDLLEVLAGHERRSDVRARLVELDAANAAQAAQTARAAGLSGVEVVTGDAALADHYRDLAPADLVLICGVFGNVTDEDIARTIDACAGLCRTGGSVVWTRNRRAPDKVPLVCARFEANGFERRWLSDPGEEFGVGEHRFTGAPRPLAAGTRMFDFVGYDVLRQREAR